MFIDDEAISRIENSKIVIYGAGAVAKKIYRALKNRGIHNVQFFVVSHLGEDKYIDDIPILEARKAIFSDELLVCVAVHYSIKDEILTYLENLGVKNHLWIYPYMFRLACGKQVDVRCKVSLRDILKNSNDYRIAIRILAIENYYGKNDFGFDLYKRSFEVACGKSVAETRYKTFIKLIESYEKVGYHDNSLLSIDEGFFLMDGAHRLALSLYHGIDNLYAEIYPKVVNYFLWDDEMEFATKNTIYKMGFSESEIEIIMKTDKRIKDEWR